MKYWLIKSEGECYSIDHLQKDKKTPWSGVRNFQARNFMRDQMNVGDLALFYHSSSEPSGVYGLAKVTSKPYEDLTARDKKNEHADERSIRLYEQSKKEGTIFTPVWMLVDFGFVKKFKKPVALAEIKNDPFLQNMILCQKGSRLSIQPVTQKDFEHVVALSV
jgi:predicted RNA-binding protein with PUA-like domain